MNDATNLDSIYVHIAGSIAQAHHYTTASETADPCAYRRAIDVDAMPMAGMMITNVCISKSSDGSTCGIHYPSKMWHQAAVGPTTKGSERDCGARRTMKGSWSVKCRCEWGYLLKEAHNKKESERAMGELIN